MRLSKLLLPLFAVILAAGALAACGSSTTSRAPAAAVPGTSITIKNFAFSPATLSVSPGARLTVHNEDAATHTVTSVSNAFNTGDVAPGATVTFTAPTSPGTYAYICMIHQFMHGTLVVN